MKRKIVVSGSALTMLISCAVLNVPDAVAGPATLPNGFTAAVVAHSGQKITGTVNASGYDLGVYIGPGVHDVTVSGATVTGANDSGILVQDAANVAIKGNTVAGNAVSNPYGLAERKAIVLIGTSDVLVTGNTVTHNGDGGIGVYDDGVNPQSVPVALHTGAPVPATDNVVTRNTIVDNFGGCGIVVSAKNDGGLVAGTNVSFNTVKATVPGAVGGLIIASGAVGAGTVADTVYNRNTVSGGYIAGIGMHSSGGGVLTGTHILGNDFSANGGNAVVDGHPVGTGVEILGNGTVTKTQILHNTVSDDYYGVFHIGDTGTHISQLSTHNVAVPVGP
jgi:nitrous oxidase accessory protein NosD